jgi:hypothetical protein
LNEKLIEVRKMVHGLRNYLLNGKQWAVNCELWTVISTQCSVSITQESAVSIP